MKNARGVRGKMVCASLFIVIHYSFVKCAEPKFLIHNHLLGALSSAHNFEYTQNCAWSSMHKCTRQKDARRMEEHAKGAMDQCLIHAEHSLGIRCAFIVWDVANTHRDVDVPHTCGAIDDKHVNFKCPSIGGSIY